MYSVDSSLIILHNIFTPHKHIPRVASLPNTLLSSDRTFSMAQVQQQFETNVFGVWRVNHAALPHMRAQKSGLLIHMGSVVGRIAFPFVGLYGATKFALEGLTESYRDELAPFGIDAVIVEPGTYPTTIA